MSGLVLQRLPAPATMNVAPLYYRRHPTSPTALLGERALARGETLDLDTYFGSFAETVWRRHTRLAELSACVEVAGPAVVRLWRQTRDAGRVLLDEARTDATGSLSLTVPPLAHARAAGRLSVSVTARRSGVVPSGLRWLTTAPPARVGLVPVITTFNRPDPLAAVLRRLGQDAEAVAAISAMLIVNNGSPGLAARLAAEGLPEALGARLRVIEQGNFGGAGGFTRGLLEARGIDGATHAVLIDDDVELEPEALFRAARFFCLAEGDVTLGGHMLDLFRPTHLYEAGALVDPRRLVLLPLSQGVDLAGVQGLDCLLEPPPMHYNGWWFMALPLRLLDKAGWPLSCFIRGDDVEFGLRLHDAGVPTVSMPGVAIWHEPFYAKLHGWHVYYETRNMLVAAARHLRCRPAWLGYVVLKWVVADLLTYRYQRAALRLRAVRDFLDGPAVFDRDPRPLHAGLAALCREWPLSRASRERVFQHRPPPAGPRSRLAFVAGVGRALAGEWLRRDADRVALRVLPRDHVWFRLRGADQVAVDEPWEADMPLFVRRRASFRRLMRETVQVGWRLARGMPGALEAWRAALPRLTSEAHWRSYLGLAQEPADPARQVAGGEGPARPEARTPDIRAPDTRAPPDTRAHAPMASR